MPLDNKVSPRYVIDALHKFPKKRYDYEYRWTFTQEIEETIVKGRARKRSIETLIEKNIFSLYLKSIDTLKASS